MKTFICVLKSGGDYGVIDVIRMREQLQYFIGNHKLVCLSDIALPNSIIRRELKHDWPGWWSKLELFRKDLFEEFGQMIYLDLDTVVMGRFDKFMKNDADFAMLRDFYHPMRCASGVMSWKIDLSVIYREWLEKSESLQADMWMKSKRPFEQEFVHTAFSMNFHRHPHIIQDIDPGIVSYKVHCKDMLELPDEYSIVCFHGKPRPIETAEVLWWTNRWASAIYDV